VLLFRVDTVPEKAVRLDHTRVAEGELTGHCHEAVGEGVELLEKDGVLYLVAPKGARVRHQEHAPIEVPEGTYRIGQTQEYDHFQEEARRMRD